MTTVTAQYGFRYQDQNGKYIFGYKKERYKSRHLLPLLIFTAVGSFFIILLTAPSSSFSLGTDFILWLVSTILLFYIIKFAISPDGSENYFFIDKNNFTIYGRQFARKDIHSLYIKAGNSEPVADLRFNNGTVMVFRPNLAGAMAVSAINAAHATGRVVDAASDNLRKNIAKLNYKIQFQYGNSTITLAEGLSSGTAQTMFKKIEEVCTATEQELPTT